jgi:4-hydroxy-2-oxoglutarate aldolase
LALAVTSGYGVGGLKAAMDLNGYRGGHVRAPLRPASAQAREHLKRLIDELPANAG